ncbi:MAG TPA: xanthine dehydrogenase family protein subunit M [Mycobacteriales bacterium]
MIPAAFDYVRAGSVDEALALLTEHGEDAKLLAGGHSLLPMMKLRLASPGVLVDVGRLTELSYVRVEGDQVAVGALTRHRDVESSPVLRAEVPLLAHAASLVGDPQIRRRGTLGGSLVHGDPAADLPTAVLALDGVLVLRGPAGQREVPASEFFVSYFETATGPDEVLVEVRLPRLAGVGWGYQKFTRRANDWAIVGVAAVGNRVALANMGSIPLRATATERALASGASVAEAAVLADEGTEPTADMHAGPEYRRHLARLLTRRALTTATIT